MCSWSGVACGGGCARGVVLLVAVDVLVVWFYSWQWVCSLCGFTRGSGCARGSGFACGSGCARIVGLLVAVDVLVVVVLRVLVRKLVLGLKVVEICCSRLVDIGLVGS